MIIAGGGFWIFQRGYFAKALVIFSSWYPAANENGDPVIAVFFNRLPCSDAGCNKLKFELGFYKDQKTQAPTTYKLARVYVAKNPEDRIVNEGTWTITRGTKLDPQATVYQPDANAPEEFRSYLVVSEDILFILDREKQPRVGDGFYIYTLNRIRQSNKNDKVYKTT